MEEEADDAVKAQETVSLTGDALYAMNDRNMKPQPLVLSGRPSEPQQSPKFLKSKYQIGSVNGPLDFGRKQVAFHRDDINPQKLKNVEDLREWKMERSNKCGYQPRWNNSNQPENIIAIKRSRENSDHDRSNMYQYNYRAEVLPPKNVMHIPNPGKWGVTSFSKELIESIEMQKAGSRLLQGQYKRTEEMPVNPKLEGKSEWSKESRASRQELISRAKKQSEASKRSSVRGMQSLDPEEYLTPQEKYESFRDGVRTLKTAGLTKGYIASLNAKEDIPKHNRLAKESSSKERTFHHSGVYEYNRTEDLWMWSDTGSFDMEGPGDITRVRDPLAYNLASPNSIG
jgi:hypothetical protein